jgi:hypothetical protein
MPCPPQSAGPQVNKVLTAFFSTVLVPQLITAIHRHPSLSSTRTLPSHPPTAMKRPPGAHAVVRIPRPGSSVDEVEVELEVEVGENPGEVGEKCERSGPIGEWMYMENWKQWSGLKVRRSSHIRRDENPPRRAISHMGTMRCPARRSSAMGSSTRGETRSHALRPRCDSL